MIILKNITRKYGNGEGATLALDGVSLEIQDDDYISIMGPSGSGKSTLLHIIGAMDHSSSGSYYYDDVDVMSLNHRELNRFRKDHVSFVFQQFALMQDHTVYENTEIPLIARNIPKRKRRSIVMENLEKLGIAGLAGKYPANISGGEQQRCAVARALVADTDLLLLDEPTGSLDSKTSTELMDILDSVREKGRTIILVTHDDRIAARADKTVFIEDGRITDRQC